MTERELYYSKHKCCPTCGHDKTTQTYVGYFFTTIEKFKDENRAKCQCGWVGTVHDLTPRKPTT